MMNWTWPGLASALGNQAHVQGGRERFLLIERHAGAVDDQQGGVCGVAVPERDGQQGGPVGDLDGSDDAAAAADIAEWSAVEDREVVSGVNCRCLDAGNAECPDCLAEFPVQGCQDLAAAFVESGLGVCHLRAQSFPVRAEPLCGRSYVVGPVPLAEHELEFALPGAGCGEALHGVAEGL
jgi:hypothetical protein